MKWLGRPHVVTVFCTANSGPRKGPRGHPRYAALRLGKLRAPCVLTTLGRASLPRALVPAVAVVAYVHLLSTMCTLILAHTVSPLILSYSHSL